MDFGLATGTQQKALKWGGDTEDGRVLLADRGMILIDLLIEF